MKIAVLMAHRIPSERSVAREMIDLLREWGAEVDIVPVRTGAVSVTEMQVEHDLYLLTSATPSMVSYATSLEMLGARCLNRTEVVRICRDRILSTGLLAHHGVPVPESWIADDPTQLAHLLDDGPIVIKPANSADGAGTQVIWDLDGLIHFPVKSPPVLAQRFHATEHRERKVYRIGEQIFGVKRTWPARTYLEKVGEPFAIDAHMRTIAQSVGTALSSDLFGFDVVVVGDQPMVVDVHPFPGFKGVPDAALRLADYVYSEASEPNESLSVSCTQRGGTS